MPFCSDPQMNCCVSTLLPASDCPSISVSDRGGRPPPIFLSISMLPVVTSFGTSGRYSAAMVSFLAGERYRDGAAGFATDDYQIRLACLNSATQVNFDLRRLARVQNARLVDVILDCQQAP